MKLNTRNVILFTLLSLFITGCNHNPDRKDDDMHGQHGKPRIPETTVGSFNFTKDSGLVIFDVNGKVAAITDKPLPKNKKDAGIVTIKFVSGSCTAEVCRPGFGCKTVVIDPDNDCPTQ